MKELRKRNNLKQDYVSNLLKISQPLISSWENGTRTPPVDILPKLAEVLNCSIEELVYAIIDTKNNNKSKNLQNNRI